MKQVVYQREGIHINNEREGKMLSWFNDHKILTEGYCVNGRKEGLWKTHDQDGTIKSEENYQNGELHGLCIEWWAIGHKKSESFAPWGSKTLRRAMSKRHMDRMVQQRPKILRELRSLGSKTIRGRMDRWRSRMEMVTMA